MAKRSNREHPFNSEVESLDYDEGGFEDEQPNKRARKDNNGGDRYGYGHGNGEWKRGNSDRGEKGSKGSVMARVDPTFGQRSALPGLDDYSKDAYGVDDGEGEEDEDGNGGIGADALRYLMAVRLEATTIPTVLCAPKSYIDQSAYDTGLGDSRGYYSDGAYTAAPLASTSENPSEDPEFSTTDDPQDTSRYPQLAYFDSILVRFKKLREQLYTTPPRALVEALDRDHPSYMGGSHVEWKAWRWRVLDTEPKMAQLASMQRGTVLRLLKLCTKEFGSGSGGVAVGKMLSSWIWGLLARLPERGELNSEEIAVVRELGKRGVWVSIKVKGVHDLGGLNGGDDEDEIGEEEDVEMEANVEEEAVERVKDDEHGIIGPVRPAAVQETPTEDLKTAQARMLAHLSSDLREPAEESTPEINIEAEVPASKDGDTPSENERKEIERDDEYSEDNTLQNTKATIDMVLTVAGEMYGQRDLLEFREVWE